jgi:hypothetical protein
MARDPALEFQRNLVDRFFQMKALRFQQDLALRREERYSEQLQQNRLMNQGTLGLATRREERLERQFQAEQTQGTKYSSQWFENVLGYSPTTSKLLQDRYFGAAPKMRRPIEDIRDARIIIDNALSEQELNVGESMLRDAMERLASQKEGLVDIPDVPDTNINQPVFDFGTTEDRPDTTLPLTQKPTPPTTTKAFAPSTSKPPGIIDSAVFEAKDIASDIVGGVTSIFKGKPKDVQFSEEFELDLANAIEAVRQGADPNKVLETIGKTYPTPSKEFYRAWEQLSIESRNR